jgi:diguanylate cyclase (GGDEF)-like protein
MVNLVSILALTIVSILGINLIWRNRFLQKRVAELEGLALTDPLTGLYNRRYFNETLEREIGKLMRYDGMLSLSLMLIDIDHFGDFNNSHGHPFGDQVLVSVAKALDASLRASDILARIGGDEFAVILPQTNLEEAMKAAVKVRAAVIDTGVTVSIGVAQYRKQHDAEGLIAAADTALYQAKEDGRDCIRDK